jgi:pentatricopeptide repeat protein
MECDDCRISQNGHGEKALKLFQQMQLAGVNARDSKTFASILPACANLAALEQGMEIHGDIIRSGFQSDEFVVNALDRYVCKMWEHREGKGSI